ncbi:putative disease resistance protein At3g14460 [Vitis vinifera]|nr:putative disease resistance protein At3g14460 [Vitis vinifera]
MKVVGEAILSSAVGLLFDKLGSSELLKFARQENVFAELENWRNELLLIDEVLDDAEEKQITRKSVEKWLRDLRDLAYDMEDVLDEFATEMLRRKLMAERPQVSTTSKVQNLISLISTFLSSFIPLGGVNFKVEMGSKINEISRRLDDISTRQAKLGLKLELGVGQCGETFASGGRASPWQRPPTTSLINEPVQGRDKDKKDIIDLLLKDEAGEDNFRVLPIVGIGGTGKTTLAQLICQDEAVMKLFDPIAWVCISEERDVAKISKAVLHAVSPNQNIDLMDFNIVQHSLGEILTQKRFLLVLDDVWNINSYEQWNSLQIPLNCGEKGSKIIITTRNANVARSMGAYDRCYNLRPLSNDDCWSVFVRHACEDENIDVRKKLETIHPKVTSCCGGLPLAARVLGGLVRSKLHDHKWEDILNNEIWRLPSQRRVLRLSYYHLPSHLKRCFSYCALFPKDYEFEKKELVLLWMAEGLIHQSEGDELQMEDLGANYFDEMLSRSFFQPSSNNKSNFIMHGLIHDLARDIAKEICFSLKKDEMKNNKLHIISGRTRHASFIRSEKDVLKSFQVLNRTEHLRTFVALPININDQKFYLTTKVFHDLLQKLRHLRVLSLSGYEITELPDWIGDLKLLRYLNLSHTAIKWLPESASCLYNLQALILCNCINLTKLPVNIGNVINLRHLDISGSIQLKEMPSRLGDLINLQTLSKFIVGKHKRSGINELKSLLNLRGKLFISGLHNIVNIRDVKEVNLKGRHNIEELTMEWSSDFEDSRNETNELAVFKLLQPHESLKKLVVVCYGGLTFPNWLGDHSFTKIEHLSLKSCKKLTRLPPLGRLPLLKELHIEGMDEITCIGDEFYGEIVKPFPSLESLEFDNMSKWKDWEESEALFPCLRKLTIKKCPELVNLPSQLLSIVKKLHIDECQKLEVNKYNRGLLEGCVVDVPSLTQFYIGGTSRLSCLWEAIAPSLTALKTLQINQCDDQLACLGKHGSGLKRLGRLRNLEITSCNGVESLEGQRLPRNLKYLIVEGCPNLKKLPNELGSLTFLLRLRIENCSKLVSFPEASFPPMVRALKVTNCEGLKSLPHRMMNYSCVLEYLEIKGCPSLISFPKGRLPFTLKQLHIQECEKLESLPEGIMQQPSIGSSNTGGLKVLSIWGCSSLKSIPRGEFPPTLETLSFWKCEQLESIPGKMLQNLTSLHLLNICNCPELVSSTEAFLTSNLKLLAISECQNMKRPLSEWGLYTLTSLTHFMICGPFPDVISFSDDETQLFLPTSLQDLHIINFQNLKSIASMGLQSLVSLETLVLENCPKLESVVPNEGLPPTLAGLQIKDCPILKQRCIKDKGKDWLKIAQIPKVVIDEITQQ